MIKYIATILMVLFLFSFPVYANNVHTYIKDNSTVIEDLQKKYKEEQEIARQLHADISKYIKENRICFDINVCGEDNKKYVEEIAKMLLDAGWTDKEYFIELSFNEEMNKSILYVQFISHVTPMYYNAY